MNDVRDILIDALSPLCPDVYLQGAYPENTELPEVLITYFILDSPDVGHFDNMPTATEYQIQVATYSSKMSIISDISQGIPTRLLAAGFTRNGKGRDLPFDQTTGHYGWTCDFYYYEEEE